MKIISFNVNGIRAAMKKGLLGWLENEDFDIVCFQETKADDSQLDLSIFENLDYTVNFNSAEKKGYSGTAILSRPSFLSISYDFDNYFSKDGFNDKYGNLLSEGRVITVEYNNFYLINTYVPNVKNDLSRLSIRQEQWDNNLLKYIKKLEEKKPVIICGDMNVAHQEIDLANPKSNEGNAGFTKEERQGFTNYLNADLVDVFRYLYPDKKEYTWWSMRTNARERNVGWRIDYFLCSKQLINNIKDINLLKDIVMSDHCPILLEL